jgi:hypothetical protein
VVCIELREPQAPELPQAGSDQSTVRLAPAGAYITRAVRFAVEPRGTRIVGVVTPTDIGTMSTIPVADLVGSVTEVAVIMTGPGGNDAGAVYAIRAPLAVGFSAPQVPGVQIGWSEPHAAPVTPQRRLQLTPAAFVSSLATVAARLAVAFTPIAEGGGVVIVTKIGSGTIGSVKLEEMEGSLAEIAWIVTLLPTGCMGGAVKTVDAP